MATDQQLDDIGARAPATEGTCHRRPWCLGGAQWLVVVDEGAQCNPLVPAVRH